MSEQTVSKSVRKIPQRIIEEIKEFFSKPSTIPELEHPVFQKVDKVEFIRTYQNRDGIWEKFKVNDIILVSVLNGKAWTWMSVEDDEKQKKAFGKRVKYVMQKAGVPWNLAKMAVNMNPVNSYNPESTANGMAVNFIKDVKEALERYVMLCEEKMSMEEYLKTCASYFLGYLTNKQICIIKEYWLSQNA